MKDFLGRTIVLGDYVIIQMHIPSKYASKDMLAVDKDMLAVGQIVKLTTRRAQVRFDRSFLSNNLPSDIQQFSEWFVYSNQVYLIDPIEMLYKYVIDLGELPSP